MKHLRYLGEGLLSVAILMVIIGLFACIGMIVISMLLAIISYSLKVAVLIAVIILAYFIGRDINNERGK